MSVVRSYQFAKPVAGVFVVATLVLLLVGGILAGRARGWLEDTLAITATMPELAGDSTMGVRPGDEVQIYGIPVGHVTAVTIVEVTSPEGRPSQRLRLSLLVRGEWARFVRTDSEVQVRRKFGVAGSPILQVTAGTRGPISPATELPCVLAPDLTRLLEETIHEFRDRDSPLQRILANVEQITTNLEAGTARIGTLLDDPALYEQIRQMLTQVNALVAGIAEGRGVAGKLLADEATAADLTATLASVRATVAHLERTSATLATVGRDLAEGKGLAGKLLHDETTAGEVAEVVTRVNQSLAQLNEIMKAVGGEVEAAGGVVAQMRESLTLVDGALREITGTVAALRQQTADLPGVMLQTQEMMRQTTRTLEGLQRTWLLRGQVTNDSVPRLSLDAGGP